MCGIDVAFYVVYGITWYYALSGLVLILTLQFPSLTGWASYNAPLGLVILLF
jgi:hypothetical protein